MKEKNKLPVPEIYVDNGTNDHETNQQMKKIVEEALKNAEMRTVIKHTGGIRNGK